MRKRLHPYGWYGWLTFLSLPAIVAVVWLFSPPAAETQSDPQYSVEVGQIVPGVATGPASTLTSSERDAMIERHLELRELMDSRVNNNPPSPPGLLSPSPGRETQIALSEPGAKNAEGRVEFHGPASPFSIGRNNRNPRGTSASSLAEPAAANDGIHVFYMGNTHAEFSEDGGQTYTAVPIPAGPADAPFACCDPDVVYDKARGVTFWSVLYLNALGTNGVVRIFVRRTIPGANACFYDVDPAGAANNIVPDYPHLGISNNHLYLTTNNVGATWTGAQVRRFDIEQMVDCGAVNVTTFTYFPGVGQRVFVPVEGARETMYWGMLENNTTFRVFQWPQNDASPTSVTRAIAFSTHANPDCRGGVNNRDWIERSTAWSITGFRMRGAVGAGRVSFFWNVAPDAQHTQAHVHSAVFSEGAFSLIAEPHIFNNTFCTGYTSVSTNARGDLGATIGAGGRAGGGGVPVQGFVAIDDDFTPGIAFFQTLFLTAAGTHNPADDRYGDYFTIHPQVPCDLYFNATNYALLNEGAGTFPNVRYVEFGRHRDANCYFGWRNKIRDP